MARALNRLTVRQVSTIKEVGRHADGGGLYLRVTASGGRSWVFMTIFAGKRIEAGLGAASHLSLAGARRLATQMREAAVQGVDPRSTLERNEPVAEVCIVTFGECADHYISSVEKGWRSDVHRKQWRQSLRDHAAALTNLPIDEVSTDHVLGVLNPIWVTKPETAGRLRGRIEKILDAAKVRGLRPRDAVNPAGWRGHLALLLPRRSKLSRGHHAALSFQDAPTFMANLRKRPALSARCLEFIIFTAARSGEALGATWREIDWKKRIWTVPGDRMKSGVQHVVPLSQAAINILINQKGTKKWEEDDPIFSIAGAARSNMAIAMLLRRMGYVGDNKITTHGFRSTFRDFCGDETEFSREIVEAALAHVVENETERAYRRGTAIERRRVLMEAWADYLLKS